MNIGTNAQKIYIGINAQNLEKIADQYKHRLVSESE